MSRTKVIAVRLDQAELAALRRIPGATASERIRNLVMNSGIADGMVDKITRGMRQENIQLLADIDKRLTAAEQQIIGKNRGLIERLVAEMNKPFTLILDHIRGRVS